MYIWISISVYFFPFFSEWVVVVYGLYLRDELAEYQVFDFSYSDWILHCNKQHNTGEWPLIKQLSKHLGYGLDEVIFCKLTLRHIHK